MKKNQDDNKQDENFKGYLKAINRDIENQKDQNKDQQYAEDELDEDYEDYYSQSRRSDQNIERDNLYDYNQKDEDDMYQKMLQEMQDDIHKDLMQNMYDDVDGDDETYYIDQQRLQNNIKPQQNNNKHQKKEQEIFKGYKNIQQQNQNLGYIQENQEDKKNYQIDNNLIIDINLKKKPQEELNIIQKNQQLEKYNQDKIQKNSNDQGEENEDEWETDEEDNNEQTNQ